MSSMARPDSRQIQRQRQRMESEEPSIASYGMGGTSNNGSMGYIDQGLDDMSVEVGYSDPLSRQPKPRADLRARQLDPRTSQPNPRALQPTTSGARKSFDSERQPSQGKKRFNPDLPEPTREDPGSGKYWLCFCDFCTILIPDCFICRPDRASKQAWREKATIFQIFILSNIFFLTVFGVIPLYLCRVKDNPLTEFDWYNLVIDDVCTVMDYASYVIIFSVAALMALQCLCSLIMGLKSFQFRMSDDRPFEPRDMKNPVVVVVPCYNEGEKELRKTITSILDTNYPAEHKCVMVVADGIITGRGEYFNTPATLARLLGFTLDSKRDKAHLYKSLGESTENRASVYSGVLERNGKYLKYVCVIKRGTPEEKESQKPGNRGKRDSQLIALGLLNRVHHDRRLSALDKALADAFDSLGMPVQNLEYMLAIDADTRVSVSSIAHMIYHMTHKRKTLACCGETKVDNKTASWVTMIQVYEYFAGHHLKKSFESIFGTVTCLPGCFTMYRITANDGRSLISNDAVYQHYARNDIYTLHEKNLYHLGEDRMLTTILLKYFPDMSLAFVPLASCWTIVPDSYRVLISQRRRWINSTFHNMWELLKVNTMCGVCCISMNTIVLVDLFSTLVLPSAIIYAGAYTWAAISDDNGISSITIVMYGVLIGCQLIIFLVRSRLDYLFWFLIYLLLGVPVFYFILPIYSFWHMDDFSWGTTRQVEPGKKKKKKAPSSSPTAPPNKKPQGKSGSKSHRQRTHRSLPRIPEQSKPPHRRPSLGTLGNDNQPLPMNRSNSWDDRGRRAVTVSYDDGVHRSGSDEGYKTQSSHDSSDEYVAIRASRSGKAPSVSRISTSNNRASKRSTDYSGPIDLDDASNIGSPSSDLEVGSPSSDIGIVGSPSTINSPRAQAAAAMSANNRTIADAAAKSAKVRTGNPTPFTIFGASSGAMDEPYDVFGNDFNKLSRNSQSSDDDVESGRISI